MRWILILGLVVLVGCQQTAPVVLKHPKTGKTVQCGPYHIGLSGDFKMEGIAMQERGCIEDFKEQGYLRQ